jgi:preprotein translocase subunit SecA
MWPFTRTQTEVPDHQDFLWLGDRARTDGLTKEVDLVLASGSHVIVTGHHAPTLETACGILTDSPRPLELVETPIIPASLAHLLNQCPSPTCLVIGAEFLSDGPESGSHVGLKFIVLGRHPLRHYDDAVVRFASRVSNAAEVVFSVSLEDPLMKLFGGDRQRAVLQRLGATEREAITHPWLTQSLRKAQAKILQRIQRSGESPVEGFGTLTREHLPPSIR